MSTISLANTSRSTPLALGRELLLILSGSLLIALAARLTIVLPWTPVPITLQTLAVLFLGMQLGSKHGALAVVAYLVEVSMGLPVLSLGLSDPTALIGLKAGYLFGMLVEAFLIGYWCERASSSSFSLLIALCCAVATQLALGALWLGLFVGYSAGWTLGFLPFIAIELFKAICLINTHSLAKRFLPF